MSFINFGLIEGRLLVAADSAAFPKPVWLGGYSFDPVTHALLINANAATPLSFLNGLPRDGSGRIVCVADAVVAGSNAGLAMDSVGRQIITYNNAIARYEGGWPVDAVGRICCVSSGAVPIFDNTLTHTLVPEKAGDPAYTFVRATTATVEDYTGTILYPLAGEARFSGARRVFNKLPGSDTFGPTGWVFRNVTRTAGQLDPLGGTTAYRMTPLVNDADFLYNNDHARDDPIINSMWVRRVSGTDPVLMYTGNYYTTAEIAVTSAWQQFFFAVNYLFLDAFGLQFKDAGDPSIVDVWHPQMENAALGQTTPSEYVSSSVAHGAGALGVQYFDTDLAGSPIADSTLLGYLAEGQATNSCIGLTEEGGPNWAPSAAGSGTPTVTQGVAGAPDGSATVTRILYTAVSAGQRALYGIGLNINPGTGYMLSLWLKSGTVRTVYVSWTPDGVSYNTAACLLSTEWQRFQLLLTIVGGYVQIGVDTRDPTQEPQPGQQIDAWGIQIENQPFASSYIPTTTTAVTRNRDQLTFNSAGNFVNAKGSAAVQFTPESLPKNSAYMLAFPNTAVAVSFTPLGAGQNWDGANDLHTVNILLPYAESKICSAWEASVKRVVLNGGAVASGTFGVWGATALEIGWNSASMNRADGNIKRLQIYDIALTPAQMQEITA